MSDLAEAEGLILAFERDWQGHPTPDIRNYVERVADKDLRRGVLIELICLDLEYRWRQSSPARLEEQLLLEDYLHSFPELERLDALPLELIQEEYRVRCCWGDRPSHAAFLSRFQERRPEILRLLRRADVEHENEQPCDAVITASHEASDQLLRQVIEQAESSTRLDSRDYVLQKVIGAGHMGKVYRAWHNATKSHVAIKYLRKAFLRDGNAVSRFLREAQILAGFQHDGIIRIEGLGRTRAGGYFIAMELATGGDLATRIAQGPPSVADAVRWITQASEAIAYSHRRGILHCDLKPGNFLLQANGNLVVTDFGLARSIADEPAAMDCIAGTAPYMAPEQVSSYWGPMTPGTDVYGLGAVFYCLLTGTAPYSALPLGDTLARVVSGIPVVAPQAIRPDVPSAVNDICRRCLAKSREDRFSSVEELLGELHACR